MSAPDDPGSTRREMVGANVEHGGSDDGTEHLDETGRGGADRSDRTGDDTDDEATGQTASAAPGYSGESASAAEGADDGEG